MMYCDPIINRSIRSPIEFNSYSWGGSWSWCSLSDVIKFGNDLWQNDDIIFWGRGAHVTKQQDITEITGLSYANYTFDFSTLIHLYVCC